MSRRYHPPFRYMGNFKAFAADYEYYLTLSDKPVSVCLTERQMYILSVWNSYTPWMTRWYNTEDTSAAELATIAAEIEDLLMCGCGVPTPSLTDYVNSITYNNATSTTYQNTYNTWNAAGQTIASIAPDLDRATGNPVNISRVICSTLSLLLKTITEAARATQQGSLNEAADLTRGLTTVFGGLATAGSAGIAVGGAGAAIVGFFGGPWLVLGLALAAVGTGIAALIMGTQQAAFTDPDVIEQVLCEMQNNIGDNQLTYAEFQNALTPNSLTGAAAELALVVQAYLNDQTTYLQFMTAAQGIYDAADIAGMPDCACEPGFCSGGIVQNFMTALAPWTIANARGTWINGSGVRRADGAPTFISLDKAGAFPVSRVQIATNSDAMGTVTVYRRNSSTSVAMGSTSTAYPAPGGGYIYTVYTTGWTVPGMAGMTVAFVKGTNLLNTQFVNQICYDA